MEWYRGVTGFYDRVVEKLSKSFDPRIYADDGDARWKEL